jgi:RimJ/RimL family protein N-acetyltransferase
MSSSHEQAIVHYAPVLEVPGTPAAHLRLSDMGDASQIFEIVNANRAFLDPQHWTRSIRTLGDAEDHLQYGLERHKDNTIMQYRIIQGQPEESTNGPIIGTITVYQHDKIEHSAYFGYWVTEAVARQGIAFRATQRTLAYAKEVLGIRTVKAQIDIANQTSERFAVKLGCIIAGAPVPHHVVASNGYETELRVSRIWGMKL